MPQKNGQPVDTRGVLTALRAAAREEQGQSPGTLLLEQPLGFVTLICCKAVLWLSRSRSQNMRRSVALSHFKISKDVVTSQPTPGHVSFSWFLK